MIIETLLAKMNREGLYFKGLNKKGVATTTEANAQTQRQRRVFFTLL